MEETAPIVDDRRPVLSSAIVQASETVFRTGYMFLSQFHAITPLKGEIHLDLSAIEGITVTRIYAVAAAAVYVMLKQGLQNLQSMPEAGLPETPQPAAEIPVQAIE